MVMARPDSAAVFSTNARISRSIVSSRSPSTLRRSIENFTRPGMTLRLFGKFCTKPTVPRPYGG